MDFLKNLIAPYKAKDQLVRSAYFSLRATAISLLVLWIGQTLGLDSPHWAALTVWVVTQPSRGMTLSKGFYRFLGTCVGAAFAIFLMLSFRDKPWMFITMLSLWVGATCAYANLVQYFRAYGVILAGFTAALVGLTVFSHPDQVFALAANRVICIFLGISVSMLISFFLSESSSKRELFASLDQVLAQTLLWSREVFLRRPTAELVEGERQLITQISRLEEIATYAATESMQVRRKRRHVQAYMATLFALISAVRAVGLYLRKNPALVEDSKAFREEVASDLQNAATKVDAEHVRALSPQLLARAPRIAAGGAEAEILRQRVHHLAHALGDLFECYIGVSTQKADVAAHQSFLTHQDQHHARVTGLRAGLVVFVVGALWLVTGWSLGPLVLIMTAVHCGIYAINPNPSAGLRLAFAASLIAAVAAYLCLQLFAFTPFGVYSQFVWLALFLLPGGLWVTHPIRPMAGITYCANFLVFVAPMSPQPVFDPGYFFALAGGFLGSILLTLASFHFIFPAAPAERGQKMIQDFIADLERMALAPTGLRAVEWETLMYNRLSVLIRLLSETGQVQQALLEGAFAVLDMGQQILLLHMDMDKLSPLAQLRVQKALALIGSVSQNPLQVATDLDQQEIALKDFAPTAAEHLAEISEKIRDHQAFLRTAP